MRCRDRGDCRLAFLVVELSQVAFCLVSKVSGPSSCDRLFPGITFLVVALPLPRGGLVSTKVPGDLCRVPRARHPGAFYALSQTDGGELREAAADCRGVGTELRGEDQGCLGLLLVE